MKKNSPWSAVLFLLLAAPAVAAPPALPATTGLQSATTPPPIEDGVRLLRSGRALSASVAFADLLREGNYPGEESRLNYYLARSLADLELLHTAEHHYRLVIEKGPDDPCFSYALARMIDIAQITGDEDVAVPHRFTARRDHLPAGCAQHPQPPQGGPSLQPWS